MEFHNLKGEKISPPEKYGWRPAVYGFLVENNQLLFVQPNWDDKYCLPGGSMELGETPIEALKREFIEETGYEVSPGLTPIYVDSKLFGDSGKNLFFQRVSLYYKVERVDNEQGKNLDKETTEIIWKSIDELNKNDVTFFQRDFLETII